ncbi:nuclear transport factor 2-like protein [Algoriphagus namhaensis]
MELICTLSLPEDSPEKWLVDLTQAFVSYDLNEAMSHLVEDVQWTLVGDSAVVGRDRFRKVLSESSGNKVKLLKITQVLIAEGQAAIHGEMYTENGELYGFADFYTLADTQMNKAKEITSYIIKKE